MPEALPLNLFLKRPGAILDVRSPLEYQQGRIPFSHSLPLFSDEERALVGTLYKQQGQGVAIDTGLKLVGPKLFDLVQSARPFLEQKQGKVICWRGGMRSGFVARLLESLGYSISTLQGGYRTFRRWVLETLNHLQDRSPQFLVVGGLTGSGKTDILQALRALGEQVIDLEYLANHRGSAFGHLGLTSQPSQEQFENELAYTLDALDCTRPIWIEDESRLIGRCHLPPSLYQLMLMAPLFYIKRPEEERLAHLLHLYGQASREELAYSTQRISKRLGGQLTQDILALIDQNHISEAFKCLLYYYDKTYHYQLLKRQSIDYLEGKALSCLEWAEKLKKRFHVN